MTLAGLTLTLFLSNPFALDVSYKFLGNSAFSENSDLIFINYLVKMFNKLLDVVFGGMKYLDQ